MNEQNKTYILYSSIVLNVIVLLLFLSTFASFWIVALSFYSLGVTGLAGWALYRLANKTDNYESIFEDNIEDTKMMLERLSPFLTQGYAWADDPMIKTFVAVIQSYMRRMQNRLYQYYNDTDSTMPIVVNEPPKIETQFNYDKEASINLPIGGEAGSGQKFM